MSIALDELQIRPLNQSVAAVWEHSWADYPDLIKIPMEDGKVITYRREIEQPHPAVRKCVDLIKIMNDCTYGGYKPKHTKK